MRNWLFGLNVILAFAYPAIALAEVTLGASLIRRTTRHESLAELDRRGLLALTGWMTLVAAPLSAVAAAALHHQMLGGDFLGVALHWWSAEVVGELVVTPALLTASSLAKWWVRAGLARRIEGGVGLSVVLLVGVATFAETPAEYGPLALAALALPGPVLAVLGWRVGPGAVALATLLLSGVTVWFSGQQRGPFALFEPDVVSQVLIVQGI